MSGEPYQPSAPLPKAPTGIRGLDTITEGGLPAGRATLVCGGAGCGKTLLAMEFLIRGAAQFGEPGVFVAFEESARDLGSNVASLGFDVAALTADRRLVVDQVRLDAVHGAETGEYNLDGLFIRLGHAIDSIGARRVVLDTIEALFSALPDEHQLRFELQRLFAWLKDRGVTALITGERGEKALTRHGIEEYVSDCVIVLDNRVVDQNTTRRLRIVKYRGSSHGTNEYPFLIDQKGITVLPISSLKLDYPVSDERISSGIPRLDAMLGGAGFYRGSSVLVSGTAGSGKSSLSAHFLDAACRRGERCLAFLFEEAPSQVVRNMRSIGLDLGAWAERGVLRFYAARPSLHGLEMHLSVMLSLIEEFRPQVVTIDPISAFAAIGSRNEIKAMLVRLVDYLKMQGITAFMTSLTSGGSATEHTEQEISSLIDAWLLLRDVESSGERNRAMYVLKARGMAHSNQIREFLLTAEGAKLLDVYVGAAGVLTGSARAAQEAAEVAQQLATAHEIERQELALARQREALESRIAALRAEFAAEEAAMQRTLVQERAREARLAGDRDEMHERRGGD